MIHVNTYPHRTFGPLAVLWRSLVAGAGYVLATMLGGLVVQALNLSIGDLATQVDPNLMLVGTFGAGVLMTLAVEPLVRRLNIDTVRRTVVVFSLILLLSSVLNTVEALFFTTLPAQTQLAATVVMGVASLVLAVLLVVLFPPLLPAQSMAALYHEAFQQRGWLNWTARIVLAGLLFVPIYWTFGSLIAPIVLPYYTTPDLGLGLTVPAPGTILALEVARGLLFVLVVFPVVALWRESRRSLALMLGLTMAALIGWGPLMQGVQLPALLRVVHGTEITVDSLVHAAVIAWLLGVTEWKPR